MLILSFIEIALFGHDLCVTVLMLRISKDGLECFIFELLNDNAHFPVLIFCFLFLFQLFWFISPEHPSLRARGRSMLSGDRKEYADDMSTSRFVISADPVISLKFPI